jgi:RHS repeat-associated protein
MRQSTVVAGDRFKFTARELDAALSLYYYRARWYDPQAGRFLRQDPLSFTAGDTNLYRYVFNNPVQFTDPTGEIVPILIIGGVVLTVGGVGMLEWARSRYDSAFDHYLRKPIQDWTPQLQVEFEAYVRNTERIEFWGQVSGWTGVVLATCAFGADALELHIGRRILLESRFWNRGTTRIIQVRLDGTPN